ncbi:hypothetical protein F5141DRAFT_1060177 [Pisolithus sp. B1]|nr:hypothetical protein F5141DRAFT_1060177 [Pisolithus sp. B1]
MATLRAALDCKDGIRRYDSIVPQSRLNVFRLRVSYQGTNGAVRYFLLPNVKVRAGSGENESDLLSNGFRVYLARCYLTGFSVPVDLTPNGEKTTITAKRNSRPYSFAESSSLARRSIVFHVEDDEGVKVSMMSPPVSTPSPISCSVSLRNYSVPKTCQIIYTATQYGEYLVPSRINAKAVNHASYTKILSSPVCGSSRNGVRWITPKHSAEAQESTMWQREAVTTLLAMISGRTETCQEASQPLHKSEARKIVHSMDVGSFPGVKQYEYS